MHASVLDFFAEIVPAYNLAERATIEIGSQVVNGSVRPMFTGRYLGVDIAPANGVDVVADAQDLSQWADGEWPTVVSTEMLEHCPRPWLAVKEMARICEPGGYVILTARGYDERGCWSLHGYPHDWHRFSALAMELFATDAGLEVIRCDRDPEGPGWLLIARKPT